MEETLKTTKGWQPYIMNDRDQALRPFGEVNFLSDIDDVSGRGELCPLCQAQTMGAVCSCCVTRNTASSLEAITLAPHSSGSCKHFLSASRPLAPLSDRARLRLAHPAACAGAVRKRGAQGAGGHALPSPGRSSSDDMTASRSAAARAVAGQPRLAPRAVFSGVVVPRLLIARAAHGFWRFRC